MPQKWREKKAKIHKNRIQWGNKNIQNRDLLAKKQRKIALKELKKTKK